MLKWASDVELVLVMALELVCHEHSLSNIYLMILMHYFWRVMVSVFFGKQANIFCIEIVKLHN